jgi:hypothetical protein
LLLAHRLEWLLRAGVVKDYRYVARLGHVTRAWISQVMTLLYLAPDIQKQVLFFPRTERGRDLIILHYLLQLTATADWPRHRRLWRRLWEASGRIGRRGEGVGPWYAAGDLGDE